MRGRKIITDAESVEVLKSKIIDKITYYNGYITNEDANGFTFKKSMWTSKSNPLRSVSKGEIKIYKELEGIVVDYDISGNIIMNIIIALTIVTAVISSLNKDIETGLFMLAILLLVIPAGILYDRYRVLKLLE